MGIALKSAKERKYLEKDGLCSVVYEPSEVELRAYHFCVDNNIRISPVPETDGPRPVKWHIGISTPDNHRKIYKSKYKYDNHQVWQAHYEMCLYYYKKHENI